MGAASCANSSFCAALDASGYVLTCNGNARRSLTEVDRYGEFHSLSRLHRDSVSVPTTPTRRYVREEQMKPPVTSSTGYQLAVDPLPHIHFLVGKIIGEVL